MERLRSILTRKASPSYEPLNDGTGEQPSRRFYNKETFSWLQYIIYLILGISMLWAWNMFLAASPYFQYRFSSTPHLLTAFPPTLLSVFCVTNLITMGVLANMQSTANYPRRIIISLALMIIGTTLLALSTVTFKAISPSGYFAFLMIIVLLSALATGLCQNGVYAYASGSGIEVYTQAIMAGQAVAGVLPPIAQIVSVLSVPSPGEQERDKTISPPRSTSKSAFAYFLAATGISALALLAFLLLLRLDGSAFSSISPMWHQNVPIGPGAPLIANEDHNEDENQEPPARKSVSLWLLFKKLRGLTLAVFFTFAITMFFPVFTQDITTTHPAQPPPPRLLQRACFIPLAFLFFNTGDLLGRLLTLIPSLAAITKHQFLVFILSLLRVIWIPLYLLCNIHSRGAIVPSDFFYLVIVQLFFGISNGYLGSVCMMGVGQWVEEWEREAAGGFMGLCLVGGLTVGSFASFGVAEAL